MGQINPYLWSLRKGWLPEANVKEKKKEISPLLSPPEDFIPF
jgi:hypothetical protein